MLMAEYKSPSRLTGEKAEFAKKSSSGLFFAFHESGGFLRVVLMTVRGKTDFSSFWLRLV